MSIAENVAQVKERIAVAARAAGRKPEEILLVAATKMNDADRVRQAIAAGVDICGENRVQELLEKNAQGAYAGAPLHFIGHLQKNKVRQVVGLAELIHGADSLELIRVIDRVAGMKGLKQDILLEVNIGAEASKSGFKPEEIPAALEESAKFANIRVRGLMAIPPVCAFGEENRPYFAQLAKLFIDNGQKNTIIYAWIFCLWACPAILSRPSPAAPTWFASARPFSDSVFTQRYRTACP